MKYSITSVGIDELKPHEEIKEKKFATFATFASRLRGGRIHLQPIWIDAQSKVILDGHHRWSVFKELGCKRVPCIAVDYLHDSSITVIPRKKEISVSKQSVIERGLSGHPYPAKTTKHVFPEPAPFFWVDVSKLK